MFSKIKNFLKKADIVLVLYCFEVIGFGLAWLVTGKVNPVVIVMLILGIGMEITVGILERKWLTGEAE